MEIDLHNFFNNYDDKNPKHVNAVEELEKVLKEKNPDLLLDNANWVRIYRTPVEKPKPKRKLKKPQGNSLNFMQNEKQQQDFSLVLIQFGRKNWKPHSFTKIRLTRKK